MGEGLSFCERYHEATKYTPESVRRPSPLDPREQPSPFKEWRTAARFPLDGGRAKTSPGTLDAERLGRLLFHTYGVTLVQEVPGATLRFRAAPSAGALYPTEVYVALRGVPGVPDGLHAYQALEHALVPCWEGDVRGDLEQGSFRHPSVAAARCVLVMTGVWQRSAWRYRDRGYRRVLLDTGHVMGNAVLAGAAEGLRVVPVADFADDALDGLLLLDPRTEGTLLLGVVEEGAPRGAREPGRSDVAETMPSPEEGAWIPSIHDAARMRRREEPADAARSTAGGDDEGGAIALDATALPRGEPVLEAIRGRRSTRRYRTGPIPLEALGRVLAHAHPRPGSGDPEASVSVADDLLDTWVVVADVAGLAPGVYRYDPRRHALARVRRGDPRRALHDSCLRQELGRDAAATVIHTTDLPRAVARYGERAYRYAHLEAGLRGERLDLAALRLGLGASGIAGFFDDFLNDLLRAPADHAIVYLTTIGLPA